MKQKRENIISAMKSFFNTLKELEVESVTYVEDGVIVRLSDSTLLITNKELGLEHEEE